MNFNFTYKRKEYEVKSVDSAGQARIQESTEIIIVDVEEQAVVDRMPAQDLVTSPYAEGDTFSIGTYRSDQMCDRDLEMIDIEKAEVHEFAHLMPVKFLFSDVICVAALEMRNDVIHAEMAYRTLGERYNRPLDWFEKFGEKETAPAKRADLEPPFTAGINEMVLSLWRNSDDYAAPIHNLHGAYRLLSKLKFEEFITAFQYILINEYLRIVGYSIHNRPRFSITQKGLEHLALYDNSLLALRKSHGVPQHALSEADLVDDLLKRFDIGLVAEKKLSVKGRGMLHTVYAVGDEVFSVDKYENGNIKVSLYAGTEVIDATGSDVDKLAYYLIGKEEDATADTLEQ